MEQIIQLKIGDIVDLTALLSSDPYEHVFGTVITVEDNEIEICPDNGSGTLDFFSISEQYFPLPVQRYDKWGFVDKKGEIILPFDYDFANPFYQGRAWVSLNYQAFYINTKGQWVSDCNEFNEGDMTIYVVQSEGRENMDEPETIRGVYRNFWAAAGYLNQLRNYIKKEQCMNEDDLVMFDQNNCYKDRTHYLTIRERNVPKVEKGSKIYAVIPCLKANVVDAYNPAIFFSKQADMIEYICKDIDKTEIEGAAYPNEIEPVVESLEYIVDVFVLE